MKIFTGQKLDDWWMVYGLWVGRVFIGISISPPHKVNKEETNE